ncbi:MAG TPA: patatin-like phospholipase family protein [Paludibacteraceae bacterium]|nr:patatin-like phospholipase family protein [Paludibacteraceae bacterium]HPH62678.1 patatin-like phospholipase family protein [Paludibacteraceae bacterium]
MIGLCLSGGGALGLAHIGSIKALEELNITPDYISGSSMGAIVGALYAAGYTSNEMESILQKEELFKAHKLLNFKPFSHFGFSSHNVLIHILQKYIPENDFSKLKKKFWVCVVNLNTGRWEVANEGNQLHEYVTASAAFPMVFEAQIINGNLYVDGGVLNNLPVNPLKQTCDKVIGIDVMPYLEHHDFKSRWDIATSFIYLQNHGNAKRNYKSCTDLILVNAIEKFHAFNFDKYKEIIQCGYECTMNHFKEKEMNAELQTEQQPEPLAAQ